jgi:hypothetical protein
VTPRADRLAEPLVAGRAYMVPVVEGTVLGRRGVWPVIGHRHDDREHLQIEAPHWHLDQRFLPPELGAAIGDGEVAWRGGNFGPEEKLSWLAAAKVVTQAPAEAELLPLACVRPAPLYFWRAIRPTLLRRLADGFRGRRCRRGRTGWICPHHGVPLGSIAPREGIVTCPLHGLAIDLATGVVR